MDGCLLILFPYFFFLGHASGMQKFPGQGLNSTGNAGSLTTRPPRELLVAVFLMGFPQIFFSSAYILSLSSPPCSPL